MVKRVLYSVSYHSRRETASTVPTRSFLQSAAVFSPIIRQLVDPGSKIQNSVASRHLVTVQVKTGFVFNSFHRATEPAVCIIVVEEEVTET